MKERKIFVYVQNVFLFPLAPMGVLAPWSMHSAPHQRQLNQSINFLALSGNS
jgi:hypothetical protein